MQRPTRSRVAILHPRACRHKAKQNHPRLLCALGRACRPGSRRTRLANDKATNRRMSLTGPVYRPVIGLGALTTSVLAADSCKDTVMIALAAGESVTIPHLEENTRKRTCRAVTPPTVDLPPKGLSIGNPQAPGRIAGNAQWPSHLLSTSGNGTAATWSFYDDRSLHAPRQPEKSVGSAPVRYTTCRGGRHLAFQESFVCGLVCSVGATPLLGRAVGSRDLHRSYSVGSSGTTQFAS